MIDKFLKFTPPFTDKKKSNSIAIKLLNADQFSAWFKKQNTATKKICTDAGYKGLAGKTLLLRDTDTILMGINKPCGVYDSSPAVDFIKRNFSADFIKGTAFHFETEALSDAELENIAIGWGFGCYSFDMYKDSGFETPILSWPKQVKRDRVLAIVRAVYGLRNLVNAPSNDLGPQEIEEAARAIAQQGKATIKTIVDKALLDKNFPLIHTVGMGSDRRPRLIDMTWGNTKHKKLTLVGKGVAFDTGGLNLKPGPGMANMKKDMGGAAHVLALASIIMALKIPVRLRVLIAAVENSVSGSSFRPGDIMQSRKGLTIENTNTDAEGRLILADALTYACEEKPDLVIDFATLTGSARVALGPDIPPVFTNVESIAAKLPKLSQSIQDPVWPMPLWNDYYKYLESPVADMINSVSVPGDLIYSALFLQKFIPPKQNWLHLDVFAWEQTGRPGRPRGAADTGLRTALALIEDRYKK